MIILLVLLCALLIYEHFFPLDRAPVGIWTYDHDISSDAFPIINDWIREGLAPDETMPDIDMEPLYVKVTLKIADDGSYEQSVDKASYDETRAALYERFGAALTEMIREHLYRLGMADRDDLSDDVISKLINDAVLMTGTEYLMKAVPDLVPPYEELVAIYGNRGSYSVADGFLIFDGTDSRRLLFNKETMLLDEKIFVRSAE